MHIQKIFEVTDNAVIEQFIRNNGFGSLITKGNIFPAATHIPIELELNENNEKVLRGHLSKSNPQWKEFENTPEVLVIFLSHLHHYISSSWYKHANAPTWNYMSAQISGRIKILSETELWKSVRRLTDKYEQGSKKPVSLDTLPEHIQKQMTGIVGFEIKIEKTECAFKLSQNRSQEDFDNIISELKSGKTIHGELLADAMIKNYRGKNDQSPA